MKRLPWLLVILLLSVILVACERPLQNEATLQALTPVVDGTSAPSTPGVDVTPFATAQPTAAPGDTTEPAGDGQATPAEGDTADQPADATAPPAEDATQQPQEDIIHTVVAGDTVGKLAEQYGVSIEDIAAANNLANVNDLDIGQQLVIPLSGDVAAETPPDETGGEQAQEEQIHIVQAGDNLYRIGLQYGVSWQEIAAYNSLANPNDLEVGQQIRIPPATDP